LSSSSPAVVYSCREMHTSIQCRETCLCVLCAIQTLSVTKKSYS
jgi:hypothetical protein